ncbi:MAG TPA: hypothetical protein EYG03_14045 [Planctomycetes bacterium]|nr:hypothetical protein [Planctomycetota bacterium]
MGLDNKTPLVEGIGVGVGREETRFAGTIDTVTVKGKAVEWRVSTSLVIAVFRFGTIEPTRIFKTFRSLVRPK